LPAAPVAASDVRAMLLPLLPAPASDAQLLLLLLPTLLLLLLLPQLLLLLLLLLAQLLLLMMMLLLLQLISTRAAALESQTNPHITPSDIAPFISHPHSLLLSLSHTLTLTHPPLLGCTCYICCARAAASAAACACI
jgi:hypothetical protein